MSNEYQDSNSTQCTVVCQKWTEGNSSEVERTCKRCLITLEFRKPPKCIETESQKDATETLVK